MCKKIDTTLYLKSILGMVRNENNEIFFFYIIESSFVTVFRHFKIFINMEVYIFKFHFYYNFCLHM